MKSFYVYLVLAISTSLLTPGTVCADHPGGPGGQCNGYDDSYVLEEYHAVEQEFCATTMHLFGQATGRCQKSMPTGFAEWQRI